MTEEINTNESELLEAMAAQGEQIEYKACAGAALSNSVPKASLDAIIEAVRQVYDPEIPINVYDMGLIYAINQQENGDVFVDMTLTAPGCPVAGVLPQQVADAVSSVAGTGKVEVKVVWEPQWTIERMTDEAKAMIDLF